MKDLWWLMYVGMAGGLILMCVIACSKKCPYTRKAPINYFLLAGFTIFWSLMVTCFTAFFDPYYVAVATIMTAAMTIGLILTALIVKGEMTWCYGLAGGLFMAFWPLVILSFFWRSYWLSIIISFIGAGLAAIYIVLDTKHIMTRMDLDEYILGALMLYSDII